MGVFDETLFLKSSADGQLSVFTNLLHSLQISTLLQFTDVDFAFVGDFEDLEVKSVKKTSMIIQIMF